MEYLQNLLELSLSAAPWLVLGLLVGGLIKAIIPMSFLQRHLGGHGFIPVVKAAVFGAPLPLCSCGVIPAALGLRRGGASKSATTSFLVSTPETGVDSVAITYALMGPFMAIVRPIAAVVSAITAGMLVGRTEEADEQLAKAVHPDRSMAATSSCCSSEPASTKVPDATQTETEKSCCAGGEPAEPIKVSTCCSAETENSDVVIPEKAVVEKITVQNSSKKTTRSDSSTCCGTVDVVEEASCCSSNPESDQISFITKAGHGIRYAFTDLYSNLIFWLSIGLLFAAAVKTFVPISFLTDWGSGLPAMILMILIGIPMYVCASASTPIAAGFMLAGVSPGTALVFLMAGPATNISTLGIIHKELGRRALVAYLTGVSVVALLAGLLTDYLIKKWSVDINSQLQHGHDMLPIWLSGSCLIILIGFGLWHVRQGRVSMSA